ncbi:hypothetical protein PVAND_015565 [Polypedilum vanderplanki]|uniref:F-box domain-containing protein n=1 Tax=Polypedilum vanderplanki TaxID=319348 RepID=A0A9J6BCZ0_POLVA|nr:hypothetical protein PVAND_015565 [Polypedilum vanderplanki]
MIGTKRSRKGAKVDKIQNKFKPNENKNTTELKQLEELTIENIPDHILMMIFKTFDKETIENAAKVCKRWKTLISSSTNLMDRLEIILNIKSKQKTQKSLKQFNQLPYRKIIIRSKFHPNQQHLSMLKKNLRKHQNHIEQIDFFLASSTTVCSILSHIRADLITHLKLTQSFRELIDDSKKIELPNLTYLEAHQASSFLKMIKIHRLETVKIIHAYDDIDGLDQKINSFLITCKNLKSLLFEKYFPILTVDKFEFKLKSLSVSNAENEKSILNARQYESLKQILSANFDTLETLLIGNYKNIDGILEYFYPRVKKLENLFLICPTINRIDEAIENNRTIKDLCLVLHSDCDVKLLKTRKIVEHSKNVEVLSLSCVNGDMSSLIVEASKSIKNLKTIRINNIKGNLKDLQIFDNLEEIYIERLFEQNDVKPFMKLVLNSPKLKLLNVRYWGCDKTPFLSKDRLAKILTTCKELEKFHFGGFFRLPNSFVETLIETKSNLKNLEIESVLPEIFKENFDKITKNTNIKCTVLKWKAEKKNLNSDGEQEEEEDSDLEDYDFDNQETESENEMEFGNFVRLVDPFPDEDDDDEEEQQEEEEENNENEIGLRRSKRLRRN